MIKGRSCLRWLVGSWLAKPTSGRYWCPTIELHDPPPGYESGAPLSELEGRIGADGWICTSCLLLTKQAHISMCFNGKEGCRNAIRFRPDPHGNWHPILTPTE